MWVWGSVVACWSGLVVMGVCWGGGVCRDGGWGGDVVVPLWRCARGGCGEGCVTHLVILEVGDIMVA
jgi:hypothetical protein